MPRGAPSRHATITISDENRQFLKDRSIALSTFVNQQIEAFAASNSDLMAVKLAQEAKFYQEEHKKRCEELRKRGFPDYQTVLTSFDGIVLTSEEKNLRIIGKDIRKYHKRNLDNPDNHHFIISWLESRAKDYGLNRPPEYILEQVLKQEAEA